MMTIKRRNYSINICSIFTQDNGQQLELSPPTTNQINKIDFDVIDVFEILQSESVKLSSGPDRIPHIVYRRLAAVLAHPLYLIFKESVNTGILPKLWKEAEVLPIFKNGSRTSVDNYRPISLTCVACRALERLICKKLYDYCCKWSIISANQHGFQRRRSTITQLLECMNVWTHAFENKEIVKIAYLDFRKAFDTVSHTKLLSVLENKGIRGDPLRWIIKIFLPLELRP